MLQPQINTIFFSLVMEGERNREKYQYCSRFCLDVGKMKPVKKSNVIDIFSRFPVTDEGFAMLSHHLLSPSSPAAESSGDGESLISCVTIRLTTARH